MSEDEQIFFKASGTNTIYLTGNYVIPTDEGRRAFGGEEEDDDDDDDDDEGEYDLPPDDDEVEMLVDADEESDDLDGLEDPRVVEVESEEDEAPKLIKANGQKKRAAEKPAQEESLDEIMAKDSSKSKPVTNGETAGLSKKQLKKVKMNNGQAATVEPPKENKESSKPDKKVQFAKNLEQGPTPSPNSKPTAAAGSLGVKEVKGVKIDDKKLGKGPAAKAGQTVAMRYIGKLEDGKVFDGMFIHFVYCFTIRPN